MNTIYQSQRYRWSMELLENEEWRLRDIPVFPHHSLLPHHYCLLQQEFMNANWYQIQIAGILKGLGPLRDNQRCELFRGGINCKVDYFCLHWLLLLMDPEVKREPLQHRVHERITRKPWFLVSTWACRGSVRRSRSEACDWAWWSSGRRPSWSCGRKCLGSRSSPPCCCSDAAPSSCC